MTKWGSTKKIDDERQLAKINALEQELGGVIVVFEPVHRPATLSKEQMDRLRAVEKDLSVTLVAYEVGSQAVEAPEPAA